MKNTWWFAICCWANYPIIPKPELRVSFFWGGRDSLTKQHVFLGRDSLITCWYFMVSSCLKKKVYTLGSTITKSQAGKWRPPLIGRWFSYWKWGYSSYVRKYQRVDRSWLSIKSWVYWMSSLKASPREAPNGWWSQHPVVNVGKDPTCQGRQHSPGVQTSTT